MKFPKLTANIWLAVAITISCALGLLSANNPVEAQTAPGYFVQVQNLATAQTASGAASSSRGVNVQKTYQVTGSTGSGTGTAVVTIQGSNDSVNYDNIGTVTLTLSTTQSSGSFTSNDRYLMIRPNASTLTGTTATYTATMAF